ncbi:hypothetical protein ACFQFG_19055 [Methylobacterium persicinum]
MTGAVLLALLPIALLIGLGALLRRIGFIGEAFWPQAERLGYYVLLPSLFIHGLATARLDGVPVLSLAAVLVASTVTVALALLALRPRLALDGAAFTSVFQGESASTTMSGSRRRSGCSGPRASPWPPWRTPPSCRRSTSCASSSSPGSAPGVDSLRRPSPGSSPSTPWWWRA